MIMKKYTRAKYNIFYSCLFVITINIITFVTPSLGQMQSTTNSNGPTQAQAQANSGSSIYENRPPLDSNTTNMGNITSHALPSNPDTINNTTNFEANK
jgi:hypothetical protein